MTISRRFRRVAAACAFAPALVAGCANSSQFTAGRLPYGGAQTASAEASPQDPFLAQAGGAQAAQPTAGMPAGQPPGMESFPPSGSGSAPAYNTAQAPPAGFTPQVGTPVVDPHQAAYLQQQAENPFIQASASASQVQGQTEWANFETPAAPAESNPFAEIQGQPAVARGGVGPTVSAESLPQITPAGAATDSWEPAPAIASQGDEFLPPSR
jgi:hypothetical protein